MSGHITQNDLHEKYLLHRLESSEKTEYEKHLLECESCRKELEIQRLLISHVREIGRQQMKAEIREQAILAKTSTSQTNWPALIKIAAVLLFVLLTPTVYYYYTESTSSQPVMAPAKPQVGDLSEALREETPAAVDDEPASGVSTQEGKTEQPAQVRPILKIQAKKPERPVRQTPATFQKAKLLDKTEVSPDRASGKNTVPQTRTEPGFQAAESDKKQLKPSQDPENMKSVLKEQAGRAQDAASEQQRNTDRVRMLEQTPKVQQRSSTDKSASLAVEPLSREKPRKKVKSPPSPQPIAILNNAVPKAVRPPSVLYRFTSGGKQVLVHVKTSSGDSLKSGDDNLPETFSIQVIRRDSSSLEMVWDVDAKILRTKRSEMHIELSPDQTLRVILKDGIYTTNVKRDSAVAVREKE